MRILFLSLILLAVGCTSTQSEFGRVVSSEELLNEIIDRMESESINKYHIDWSDFREQVFHVADSPAAETTKFYGYERNTLLAIRKAFDLLDDKHSLYITSYGIRITGNNRRSCAAPYPVVTDIPDQIGYVNVGSLWGNGPETTVKSTNLQKKIKDQDSEDTIGWIIDLRGNSGGNMSPMFTGISSILGDVVTGYFIDPDGNEVKHEVKDSAFWIDGDLIHKLSQPMYELINESANVAVLIDKRVASAGEAVAISFKKRANTKFFGTPTCGLSTSNYGSPMRNGGMLILTTSTMADREKELYGDSILPDIHTENPSDVVRKAIEWLSSVQ